MSYDKLSDLVDLNYPEAVLEEVLAILEGISPAFETTMVKSAFRATVDLFEGRFPGYQRCNTEYHDLRHTTDTFLALARLLHGANLNGVVIDADAQILGLIAALLHDSGYIQEEDDVSGTGAKYTTSHVNRSADFFDRYCRGLGFLPEGIKSGRAMIMSTDVALDFSHMADESDGIKLLGKLLAAADLMAQMADRTYLEKLLFLYHEFKEAGVGGFASELDLLEKTAGFVDFIMERLDSVSGLVDRFTISHFRDRWNIPANLYQQAIDRQLQYLDRILKEATGDPLDHLKRNGIVHRVRARCGATL